MARQQRLQTLLERGIEALNLGDFEAAETALEQCQRIDRKHPEVMILDGELSLVAGEPGEAEQRFRDALAAAPGSVGARVGVAKALLHQLQDDEDAEARRRAEEALAVLAPLAGEADALLVRVGVIASLDGEHPDAAAILEEMGAAIEEFPALALDGAAVIAHFDQARALRWLARAEREDELRADALYEVGCVHADAEEQGPQVAAWRKVWELDGEEDVPELADADVFEEMAQGALDELPASLTERLERVAILIDDRPSLDMVQEGVDPRSLGLFTGTPMPAEHAEVPTLTHIHIFKRNLERTCADLEELEEQVRVTVWHETAHFFGLDEDEVAELGLE
ncbi:MAG: metallopeptidase family protein [Kofleriaceae bacterium]